MYDTFLIFVLRQHDDIELDVTRHISLPVDGSVTCVTLCPKPAHNAPGYITASFVLPPYKATATQRYT